MTELRICRGDVGPVPVERRYRNDLTIQEHSHLTDAPAVSGPAAQPKGATTETSRRGLVDVSQWSVGSVAHARGPAATATSSAIGARCRIGKWGREVDAGNDVLMVGPAGLVQADQAECSAALDFSADEGRGRKRQAEGLVRRVKRIQSPRSRGLAEARAARCGIQAIPVEAFDHPLNRTATVCRKDEHSARPEMIGEEFQERSPVFVIEVGEERPTPDQIERSRGLDFPDILA